MILIELRTRETNEVIMYLHPNSDCGEAIDSAFISAPKRWLDELFTLKSGMSIKAWQIQTGGIGQEIYFDTTLPRVDWEA